MEAILDELYDQKQEEAKLSKAAFSGECQDPENEPSPSAEPTFSVCTEGMQDLPAACSNVFYQTDLVSVPIKVFPYARAGHCTSVCCGSPVITAGNHCQGETDQICEFTITQKVCVKLPLQFGASVSIDAARIQCGGISETDCDCKNPCIRKCEL